ncbi:MAG: class I SAM-dependent methyltransferase [Chloroflexi bacterium]|nr:class I SAM-dependent methyltransferase [Chloroflexota bacterium]
MKGHKWFAALYDRIIASEERRFLKDVRADVAGGATGRVLELGAGTGLNFAHYRDGAQVVATEPDPYMFQRAERRLREAKVPVELKQAAAEDLPFDDASFDTVVSTLVMCSVRDPREALAEIRRVLRPAGEYRFYEHVRYDHPFGAFWQDLVTPAWRWFGAGCHPNRDVGRLIRGSGFEIVTATLTKPLPPVPPMVFSRPHLQGVAKPSPNGGSAEQR